MSDLRYIVNQKIEKDGTSICETCSHKFVCRAIDNQPCTECNQYSPEVRRGKWIMHDDGLGLTCECSVCHIETMGDTQFCPNCGANMREEQHG